MAQSGHMETPVASMDGRIGVLVLGMHRSGTSALTRTLNLLGCDLPKTLVPAAPGNEAGHWESEPICRLNDALLDSAGTSWRDFESVNPDWFRSPKAGEFREKAVAALKQEFGASWLFVLKDPRICRIAGWWAQTIEAAGARAAIITIVRHPLEVAQSLRKRDQFDVALGVLLWLRNTLDAEAQTRGRARVFVSYDGLLSDWAGELARAAAALGLSWPKRQGHVTPAIDQFLSEKHRHHRGGSGGDDGANAWAREAFEILRRWSVHGENAGDFPALDRIRGGLDEASHAFSRLVSLQWHHQNQAARLEKNLGDADRKAVEIQAALSASEGRLQQSGAEIAALKSRLVFLESALRQREVEAEDAARDAAAAAADLADARSEIESLTATLAERRSAHAAELAERFNEIAALSALLKRQEEDRAAFLQAIAGKDDAMAQLKSAEVERIETALSAFAAVPLFPLLRGPQLRRRAALLRAAGFFDADWYRMRYADIADSGIDPALHFLKFGLREGRYPNPEVARARGDG